MNHPFSNRRSFLEWAAVPRVRIWITAFVSLGICGLIASLHVHQRRVFAHEVEESRRFRQARLDLAEGFIQVTNADVLGSPDDRVQGIALLFQTVQAFEVGTSQPVGGEPVRLAFATDLERFRNSLAAWGNAGRDDAKSAAEFRADYHRLASHAARADVESQTRLQNLARRQETVFGSVLGGVGVLLLMVFGFVILAGQSVRRQELTRRQAADRERQSIELLWAVVGGTTDAMFVKDRDGKYLLVNNAVARFAGKPTDELLGKDDNELFDPESAQIVIARDRKIMASGEVDTAEEELTAEGVTRTFLATKLPYRDINGNVIGLIGISRDITDRKEAERQLRAERDRFEKIVEAVPVVICSFHRRADGTACFSYASRRIEDIYGLTPEQLAINAAPIFERYNPDDVAPVQESIAESARNLSVWRAEFRVRHSTRGEIWVEGCAAPARQPDGSTVWHGYIADITTRKRTEQAVRESEERFRGLVAAAMDGIISIDADHRVILFNRAAERIFCVSAAEMIGRPLDQLIPARYRAAHPTDIDAFGRTGVTSQAMGKLQTIAGVRANGEEFPIESSISQIEAGGRKVYTVILRDVTEREQAADALRESEQRFRTLVEHATDGIFLHAASGVILDVNDWACSSLGYTRDELIGKMPTEFDSTVTPAVLRDMAAALERGELVSVDSVHRRKDGSTFPVELRVRPFFVGGQRYGLAIVRDITERKRAELEVRANRAKLTAALDSMSDALFISDAEGRFVELNDAFATFHKFRSKDDCLQTLAEYPAIFEVSFPSGEIAPLDMWAVPRALRGEVGNNVEYRIRRKDTGETWIGSYNFAPIRDPDGTIVGAVIVGRDVTVQREAEVALRESRERLQLALSAGRLGIWEWDVTTDSAYWSPDSHAIMGVAAGEFGGNLAAFQQLVHPEDWNGLWRKAAATLAVDGPTFDHEFRIIRRDGEVRWLMNRAKASRGPDGRATRLTGVVADITDRKTAEESRAHLAAIVESTDDAICSKSLEGTILTWNTGAERLFGYTAQEAIGQPITMLFPPERVSEKEMIMAWIRRGEQVKHYDSVRVAKDGRRINVSLTISPIRDASGRIVGAAKIVRDVTDRVRARQRLEVQHAVISILAEADSLEEAMPAILLAICESFDWAAGDFWIVDEAAGVLTLADIWTVEGEELVAFRNASRRITFGPGVGLPGRVWATGQGLWVSDVISDPAFVRKAEAATAGLRWAFGFPVMSGGAVLGVAGFYSKDCRFYDEDLLRMFDSLGVEIGQFVEQKQAKDALRESEARVRATFEQAAVGIAHVGLDGRFLWVNERYAALTGYTREELVGGCTLHAITHPDDRPRDAEGIAQLLAGEIPCYTPEKRFIRKDGVATWVQVTVSAPRLADGRPIHLIGVAQDITDRKRAEAALRESEGLLRLALTAARMVAWEFDPASGGLVVSDNAGDVFGLPPGSTLDLAEQGFGLVHPEDVDRHRAAVMRAVEECGTFLSRFRLVRPVDRAVVWMEDRGQAVRGPDGAVRIGGVMIDITARKEADDRLRESEERFRNVFENAATGIAIADLAGRFVQCNPAFCRLVGYTEEELRTVDFSALVHEEDRAANLAGNLRVMSGESPSFETENRYVHKCGEPVLVHKFIAILPNPSEKPAHLMALVTNITEQRRAEQTLRESERRWRDLAEAMPHLVWTCTPDGRCDYLSRQWCEYTGRPEAEQLDSGWFDAVHPDDRQRLAAAWGEAVADGTIFDAEFRIRRHDGLYRWFKTRAVPVIDAEGQLVKWYGSNTDIEELKGAVESLQESLERFRNLIEFLPDAVFLNVGGHVTFCNLACVRLFGAAGAHELIGKTPFELHPPEWHDLIRTRIAIQKATNAPVPGIEEEIQRFDGRRVAVYVNALPIIDRGTSALLVVLHDLTEQKRLEQQLRYQEMMLREAAELAHVGGWGFDPVTGQGDWTPETARIHGLPSATVTTVTDGLGFYSGEDRVRIEAAVTEASTHGTPYDLELRLAAADGKQKWVRAICRPIIDNGKVVRVRGSFQDITDRKRAETEIRQLNTELERRVRDRTAELEASNKELESFSYSVSHDLRAPIRHIAGFTRMVLDMCGPQLPAESRGHLEQVERAARRMGQLVDDLLAFSRLGRQPVRRQPMDTRRLVEDCLGEVLHSVEGRHIDTRVGDLPQCEADLGLLRQVWLNLLANAVKYSAKSDPAVIEIGATSTPEGIVYFVKDNGVGFDMRYVHKLFGVFQRLHRAEDFEGTGIGLALVQRIVHRHGGRVWAEAELNKGAKFSFTLGSSG